MPDKRIQEQVNPVTNFNDLNLKFYSQIIKKRGGKKREGF